MKTTDLLVAALLFTTPALAHEATGPNGGALVDVGNHHIELVTKGQIVDVFVTDAGDKPVPVDGFKGTAILIAGGKTQRIVLAPVSANRLTGNAPVALPKEPKGAVQIQMPTGASIQGKFK